MGRSQNLFGRFAVTYHGFGPAPEFRVGGHQFLEPMQRLGNG
jgi:hypothetical protein